MATNHPTKQTELQRLAVRFTRGSPCFGIGIDIFADHRFDTWVLRTIRLRLNNNIAGLTLNAASNKDYVHDLYPLMAVLNHSYNPHGRYNREAADATIVLTVVRDIVEGEEILTSYLSDQDMGLMERRASLMAWLGTECMCSRCSEDERCMRAENVASTRIMMPR